MINTKEQTIINSIKDTFEGENIGLIFIFMNISLQLKLMNYKIERQKTLEKELNCIFIRINPDEKDFNIFKEINKIHRHIKKSFKKSLINKIKKKIFFRIKI